MVSASALSLRTIRLQLSSKQVSVRNYTLAATTLSARVIKHKKLVHVADMTQESEYLERDNERLVAGVELAGIRTFLVVPMLKEDELIGTFHLSRQEVRPFTEKQIELVTEFRGASGHRHREHATSQRTARPNRGSREAQSTPRTSRRRPSRRNRAHGQATALPPPQVADLIVASGARSNSKAIAERLPRSSATCAGSPASLKAPTRKT